MSEDALRRLTSLTGALVRGDDTAVRGLLASETVDWPALKQVADEHRLTGYLYAALKARKLDAFVPPGVLQQAHRTYLEQWKRGGQLLREIERIAQAFATQGLPVLFFKGPLLTARLYEHQGSRAIHDIDFLLRDARALPRYDAVLATLGYRRVSRLLLPLAWSGLWLYQLEYRSDSFALEPHWDLQRHPSVTLDRARIWSERESAPTTGTRTVPMLSDEYTLVANLLSIPADLQNASLKLRTWVELLLLWQRFPPEYDWATFWQRRRVERTRRLACAALVMLANLFQTNALERVIAAARPSDGDQGLAKRLEAAILGPAKGEWLRRRLAFELFESPLPLSLLWWSLTLPGRALAHPALTLRRLRRW